MNEGERFLVVHPHIGVDRMLESIGQKYAEARQRRVDEQLNELFDSFRDPGKYHRCRTTYRGIGGKKRLLMKAGLA